MKSRAIVGIAAVAAALSLVLSGCGSETTKTESRVVGEGHHEQGDVQREGRAEVGVGRTAR